MIASGADNSDPDTFFKVPSGISVNNVDFVSGIEVVFSQVFKDLERRGSHRLVDITPSDFLFAERIIHNGLGSR